MLRVVSSSPVGLSSSPVGLSSAMAAPFSIHVAPRFESNIPKLGSALSGSSGAPPRCPLKGSASGSVAFHGSSFSTGISKNVNVVPLSCLVQEDLASSISMRKDVTSKLACLNTTTLIYRFNGLWPHLVDLHDWMSRSWLPDLKGHLAAHFPRGPKKSRKQHNPTWWVGSHIDHQFISKEDSTDAVPPKEMPKGDSLLSSDVESPHLDPPLEVSKSKIKDKKVIIDITEQFEMHQETPRKLKEKVDSSSLDPDKETQVLPSSIALVSWANEADEVEASEKLDPPNIGNEGMEGLASTPLISKCKLDGSQKEEKDPFSIPTNVDKK